MKTFSFIGSDKNAGKTTVLSYNYNQLVNELGSGNICLSSIGINGEGIDNYDGEVKPKITLKVGTYFVTSPERLTNLAGLYEIKRVLMQPEFRKAYVLAKMILEAPVVLEGPNEKTEILAMKKVLQRELSAKCVFLLDGSIDRQFLAHPEISDEIYFSLLITSRQEQREKAQAFLKALCFPVIDKLWQEQLEQQIGVETRSLLIDSIGEGRGEVIHEGVISPFLDEKLKEVILRHANSKLYMYLNGALTKSLYDFLSPLRQMTVILENFSLYQVINMKENMSVGSFLPQIYLRQPTGVKKVYLKEDSPREGLQLPSGIPFYNIFQGAVS